MSIFEELEQSADEILKAKKSEKLNPDEISEEAVSVEDDDAEPDEAAAEPEDDGEDSGDDGDKEDGDGDDDGDVEKSLEDLFYDDGDSATSSALTEIVAKSMADMSEIVSDSKEYTETALPVIAKSILSQLRKLEQIDRTVADMSKSMTKRMDAMQGQLDSFGSQPAHARKSVANYNVADRDFRGSLEGTGAGANKTLSKSEMVDILNNELMSGSNIVTPEDIVAAESGGTMRGPIRALLDGKTR